MRWFTVDRQPQHELDRPQSGPPQSPFAIAYLWASRVLTVSLEMVMPGLAGSWLDGRLGTSPWLAIVGFALGLVLGMWHLLAMTRLPR